MAVLIAQRPQHAPQVPLARVASAFSKISHATARLFAALNGSSGTRDVAPPFHEGAVSPTSTFWILHAR